jgi:hypothetical protein
MVSSAIPPNGEVTRSDLEYAKFPSVGESAASGGLGLHGETSINRPQSPSTTMECNAQLEAAVGELVSFRSRSMKLPTDEKLKTRGLIAASGALSLVVTVLVPLLVHYIMPTDLKSLREGGFRIAFFTFCLGIAFTAFSMAAWHHLKWVHRSCVVFSVSAIIGIVWTLRELLSNGFQGISGI